MSTEDPTQLDRIEQKLDQLLAKQPRRFPTAYVEKGGVDDRPSPYLCDDVTPEPKWGRWKTAAAILGIALGLAAVAAGSWWLWGVFIRMHV